MNITVLGAYGQLGRSIKDLSANYSQYDFLFTDMDTLDISNYQAIKDFVISNNPDVFINCAAYTAVDKAESEGELAMQLNVHAVANLAEIATENNILMIHVSTDYVFDGKGYKPYKEDDKTNPVSVYGLSKWKGEQAVMASQCRAAIIRTSWLYSEYGNNFVKTMLRLGSECEQLTVVSDQIGSPTYAHDLAEAIMQVIGQNEKIQKQEIYHFSNEGVASWYDFALEIMQIGKIPCNVLPIATEQYPTPARRPYYSVLDKRKIKSRFSVTIPHWKSSLEVCMKNMFTGTE